MPALCAATAAVIAHELAGGNDPWLSVTTALGLVAGLTTGVRFMESMRRLERRDSAA